MLKVKQPIIIIGTGRCGSTIFVEALGWHSQLAWPSNLVYKFPSLPILNAATMKLLNSPLLENKIRGKIIPDEVYPFWDTIFPPFRIGLDTDAKKINAEIISKTQSAFGQFLNQKRNKLLLKITGWPRISMLQKLFPDAKIIHMVRDGRAVMHSNLKVKFWNGWNGPENWSWGKLSPELNKIYKDNNESKVVLAALQWMILMDSFKASKQLIKNNDNFIEVKYEEMCAQPDSFYQKICDFCEINYDSKFKKIINNYNFRNTNNKWAKNLKENEKVIINKIMESHLNEWGYQL